MRGEVPELQDHAIQFSMAQHHIYWLACASMSWPMAMIELPVVSGTFRTSLIHGLRVTFISLSDMFLCPHHYILQ